MSGDGDGPAKATAYVAVGSNVGDAKAHARAALRALAAEPQIEMVRASSLYETDPVGCSVPQRDYVNAVARLRTTLSARGLLARLLEIERAFGRKRGAQRNLPRKLDLDLLLFGDQSSDAPELALPHPGMCERAFVLVPLAEIDESLALPDGRKVADLLARCPAGSVRLLEAAAW